MPAGAPPPVLPVCRALTKDALHPLLFVILPCSLACLQALHQLCSFSGTQHLDLLEPGEKVAMPAYDKPSTFQMEGRDGVQVCSTCIVLISYYCLHVRGRRGTRWTCQHTTSPIHSRWRAGVACSTHVVMVCYLNMYVWGRGVGDEQGNLRLRLGYG